MDGNEDPLWWTAAAGSELKKRRTCWRDQRLQAAMSRACPTLVSNAPVRYVVIGYTNGRKENVVRAIAYFDDEKEATAFVRRWCLPSRAEPRDSAVRSEAVESVRTCSPPIDNAYGTCDDDGKEKNVDSEEDEDDRPIWGFDEGDANVRAVGALVVEEARGDCPFNKLAVYAVPLAAAPS